MAPARESKAPARGASFGLDLVSAASPRRGALHLQSDGGAGEIGRAPGDWYQLNANEYPGDRGVDEEGNALHARAGTFGVFEPKELVCAMGKASNPLVRRKDSSGVVDLEIPDILQGRGGPVLIDGEPALSERGSVRGPFRRAVGREVHGRLPVPRRREACLRLTSTFEVRVRELQVAQARPPRRTPQTDDGPREADGHVDRRQYVTYKMTKSPHGHLDVIFLDDEMRITRGNKGTVVIAERARDSVAA